MEQQQQAQVNLDKGASSAPCGIDAPLVARLRNTPNWRRESYGHWKDMTSEYDRAPFEAADEIERLQREVERLEKEIDNRVNFTEPQRAETSCCNCGRSYAMSAAVCPACQATNANRDLERAQAEATGGCETCRGKGTIDERLGGEFFSNPQADCPDCDGHGYPKDAAPRAA